MMEEVSSSLQQGNSRTSFYVLFKFDLQSLNFADKNLRFISALNIAFNIREMELKGT